VAVSSAALAAAPAVWRYAYAASTVRGPGPYGPLVGPDANGLLLPAGFTSRVIARSGLAVAGTSYIWPAAPDGAATFAAPGGGWHYAVNSEVLGIGGGGASGIRFGPDGSILAAYSILSGTSGNCAGGPTPWGTWLSCEETQTPSNIGEGQVWECDPTTAGQGIARPAMGKFNHEAAAVDPVGRRVYLTEDRTNGRFYRFTPTAYPDLRAGLLEVVTVGAGGAATWSAVPDPSAASATTRTQVPQSTAFNGGEGCWYDRGFVFFTTKGDNRVWAHDVAGATIAVLYDAADFAEPPLTGVDNLVVAMSGDIYVAEDGGNMEINLITPGRTIAPFVRVVGNEQSEITGPAFDPSGARLYFSSQRGPAPAGSGVTYEVIGRFRTAAVDRPAPVATTATLSPVAAPALAAEAAPSFLPATGGPGTATLGLAAFAAAAAAWSLHDRARVGAESPGGERAGTRRDP